MNYLDINKSTLLRNLTTWVVQGMAGQWALDLAEIWFWLRPMAACP